MSQKRPIYYDTETTGTNADKDRIVEIAAFDPHLGKTFVSLVNPECPIPKEASAIHKITDDMVLGAPKFQEVAVQFTQFCEGDVILIAHNNDAFDKLFLEKEFKRCGIAFPRWIYIDSLKWARKYRPDLPSHALQRLREVYRIPANQAHRALDDVKMLHMLFSEMIDDLSIETVFDLLSSTPLSLDAMPFGKYKGKLLSEVPKDYVSWLRDNGVFDKSGNENLKIAFQKMGSLN